MATTGSAGEAIDEALAAEAQQVAGAPTPPVVTASSGGLSKTEVALLLGGTLGAALGYLVPMVFTLALKLDLLDPGNAAALGLIIGAGSVVTLVTAPLTGILSDRLRTRWGRRRPFTVAGILIGVVAIAVMSLAPTVLILALGWVLANLGWGTALGSISNIQADRLAPSQRGKVGAFTGVVTQVAPVTGILLVSPFTADIVLAMWLPALIGLPLVLAFVLFVHEEDTRAMTFDGRLTFGGILRSYGYRPRDFPDFSWNWLGRFFFFAGITFTSTYSTFFFAVRLGIPLQDIAPVVALMSAIGTGVSAVGAIASGWMSDRVGRRRPFVLVAVVLFAAGTVVSALSFSLLPLIIGGVLSSLGVAVFLAINQAMVLDVLPHRETQAGRFMGITSFSQKIPSALAPLVAPLILTAGMTDNYALLYLTAGTLVLAGGLLITWKVKGVR